MTEIVNNVDDRRRSYVGSWVTERLVYDKLGPDDIGRTVIYRDHGRAEAGTITSWKNGIVFARYSRGDTAAGASAADLVFGIRPLDTPEEILEAYRGAYPDRDKLAYVPITGKGVDALDRRTPEAMASANELCAKLAAR